MFKYFKDEKAFNIRNILNKIIVPHKITVLYFFNKIKIMNDFWNNQIKN
jgi:hypothetical protein